MFDPKTHLTQLPQGKDRDGKERYAEYLEVKWRLCWFREQCPAGTIDTEEITVDLDRECQTEAWVWNNEAHKKEKVIKQAKGYARYRAIVTDGKGGRATAHKSESAVNFEDYIEKAETGAVGRALAMLGYGTQFTGDELAEDHRIVDAPVESKNGHQNAQTVSHPSNNGKAVSVPPQREEVAVASPAPEKRAEPKLLTLGQLRTQAYKLGYKDQKQFEMKVAEVFGRKMSQEELIESANLAKLRGDLQKEEEKQKATTNAGGGR